MSSAKELRNQIVGLKKKLQSSPKSENEEIKEKISSLEASLAQIRSARAETTETTPILPENQNQFKPSKNMLKKQALNAELENKRRAAYESMSHSPAQLALEAEVADLHEQLSSHSLAIHEINPDGNCLFSAVNHQLQLLDDSNQAANLRLMAVDYIISHREEFTHFLEEPLEEYCERVKRNGEWGGQLELVALSKALKRPIRVFQAFSPPLIFSPDASSACSFINISFHRRAYCLGEHYNSLTLLH